MWPLLASLGPRLLIPGFFVGPKLAQMDNKVQIFQTIALSLLFVTFAVTLFSEYAWLSVIPGVAAWAYWNMLQNPNNQELYRYTDWAITTPIMLLAILLANNASLTTIVLILCLDLIMIGAGYLGVKQQDSTNKHILFGLGCAAFIPILYELTKMKKKQYAVYITLFLWTLYPGVWWSEEEKVITKNTASITYSVMDVITKVGLVKLLQI
jgi:bacteriorhodopsin